MGCFLKKDCFFLLISVSFLVIERSFLVRFSFSSVRFSFACSFLNVFFSLFGRHFVGSVALFL